MRAFVFMLFMTMSMPMAFVYPYIGMLVWVLLSDMNPYTELWGFGGGVRWVFIIAVVTLLGMLVSKRALQRIDWNILSASMVIFTIVTGISAYFAVVPWYATEHWFQLLKVMVIAFAIIKLVDTPLKLHVLIWVFVMSFGLWSVKGGIFTLLHGGNYHVMGPTSSFYGDNNQFALVMCMVLPLMRYLQLQAASVWVKYALWVAMGLTGLSILGTYSRGGLIGLFAVSFMLILKSRKRIQLFIVIIIALPLAFSVFPAKWKERMNGLNSGAAEQSNSFQERVHSWEFATNVAIHHPLLGGGFGVWASREMWDIYGPSQFTHGRAIHSIWFEVLAEQGFVGISIYLAMLMSAMWYASKTIKICRRNYESKWMSDLGGHIQVSFVGFMVSGSALPQAYFNFLFQLFAVIVVLRRLSSEYNLIKDAMPKERSRYALTGSKRVKHLSSLLN